MKNFFWGAQFFFALFVFVLPPIFFAWDGGGQKTNFCSLNFQTLMRAVFAFFLCLQKNFFLQNAKPCASNFSIKKIFFASQFLKTFGLLFIASATFELASFFCKTENSADFVFPKNIFETFFCVLNFVFGAFYEETLFRYYLPFAIKFAIFHFIASLKHNKICDILPYRKFEAIFVCDIFKNEFCATCDKNCRKAKIFSFFSEFVSVLLFAFSHAQNGAFAILNAFFAGVVLRRCFVKTKNIFVPFAAHFLYNLLVFMAVATSFAR